ncbi:hydroxymethylglutaryl-CoA lyase [Caballeronia hypogeia]|uniref:Hydroxymethylglutaryl-CoA lyase n=1 Tax=Caballeronia hypogeia TaxID=1777140 RepID=A0A158BWN0_9BURK|nr:hydroxymethylglutaryl-CoA lyase [Caballeronia hypogeia]
MLNLMGYDTGIREQELLVVVEVLPALIGHELPGHVNKAGLRSRLHPGPTLCQAGGAASFA